MSRHRYVPPSHPAPTLTWIALALALIVGFEGLGILAYSWCLTADPLLQGYLGVAANMLCGGFCFLAGRLWSRA
jgi:hypothetical protein